MPVASFSSCLDKFCLVIIKSSSACFCSKTADVTSRYAVARLVSPLFSASLARASTASISALVTSVISFCNNLYAAERLFNPEASSACIFCSAASTAATLSSARASTRVNISASIASLALAASCAFCTDNWFALSAVEASPALNSPSAGKACFTSTVPNAAIATPKAVGLLLR